MHSKDRDTGAHSQDLILAGVEPVESIEDMLRERGFFDSVKPDNKG
jgi:hypothetical protein